MNKLLTICALALCIFCTGAVSAYFRDRDGGCSTCHKPACNTCHKPSCATKSCHKPCGSKCAGKALMTPAIEAQLCSKYTKAPDLNCERKEKRMKQEVICKEYEVVIPECQETEIRTTKRIVNIPHEVCDYHEVKRCPAPKACKACGEITCRCQGCKSCHTGPVDREVRSDGTSRHLTSVNKANA